MLHNVAPHFSCLIKSIFNMSNYITDIQLSGVTYALSAQSSGGSPTVELTQAAYDALVSAGTVASDTYYIITDAQAGDLTQYWTSAQTQSAITEATSGKADTIYVDQSVSGKVDTTTFNTYSGNVETALSGKQDTLIAGENITISGNVISAEGGSITIDPSLDSGSTNPVANSAITTALNAKSDKGNFNNFIFTSKNGNPGAMFKNDNGGSKILWLSKINGTKVFEISTLSQAANFSLVETSAITTSVTSASTDAQVPSAKAVYDAIQEGGGIDSGTVQTMIDESISGKADSSSLATVATSGSYDDLTNKPTIPTVPTSNTAFTNDAQYATSGYVDSVVSGKADTSSLATVATSGSYNDLTNKPTIPTSTSAVTSGSTDVITSGGVYQQMGGLKLVKLTQSAYDALTTKDSNTLYVIVN